MLINKMNNMQNKMEIDCQEIIKFINNHENKQGIVSMFMKGPPEKQGFMWCSTKGGVNEYWNQEEGEGLKTVKKIVLNKGWESSGYAIMMRKIQKEVEKNVFRNSPPLYDENKYTEYYDDEGKYEGDPRAGKYSRFYKERNSAENYLSTQSFQGMDDNNKNAMKVFINKGSEACVKHMFEKAGNDYGRMRSMYG